MFDVQRDIPAKFTYVPSHWGDRGNPYKIQEGV